MLSQLCFSLVKFTAVLSTFTSVRCRILRGELKTDENWVFLARFCFLSEVGRFEYDVEYPKDYRVQNILLYYDEKEQWPAVYRTNKTCKQKESVLSIKDNQVINLDKYHFWSGCTDKHNFQTNDTWLHCQHNRTFRSARERWWFIAISNCDSDKGLYLKYTISMTNHDTDIWFKHFSADELYILQTDISFLILYIILLVVSILEAYALKARHLLHRTYILYIGSVALECIGISFLCANYASFAKEGSSPTAVRLFGKSFEALSTLLLLLLLILIAKGYTVTRGRLRKVTVLKITGFFSLYVLTYASLFLYEQKFFDPGRVLYLYDSPAGYGLVGLRIISWSWFVYATIFTMIHYPEKSTFYTRLFLLYSIWFLSAPVVVLISTFIVPKWMREKLLNVVELFISLKAHFIFFVLTRPTNANKNFPFHVRTTQIDILRENGPSDGTLDQFSHHPYAVTMPNPSAPTVDYVTMFCTNNNIATNNSMEMVQQPVHRNNHFVNDNERY